MVRQQKEEVTIVTISNGYHGRRDKYEKRSMKKETQSPNLKVNIRETK